MKKGSEVDIEKQSRYAGVTSQVKSSQVNYNYISQYHLEGRADHTTASILRLLIQKVCGDLIKHEFLQEYAPRGQSIQ